MTEVLLAIVVIAVLLATLAGASVRVLREYERGVVFRLGRLVGPRPPPPGVVFRLGRLVGPRGPGLVLLIPGVDRMVRVSLRTVTLSIPPQDIITRDNVTAHVDAVTYFHVVDPNSSVVDIEDAVKATSQIAQTTLRSVLGKADLDALLSEREQLNEDLQQIIDEQTEPWGIKVTTVEIKDVGIPSTMQRAMARQAEAERERRAKIIHAEGEAQAAGKLSEAAAVLSRAPAAIQLRYLQTLSEIGSEQNSTIVFPIPLDLLRPLLEASEKAAPAEQAPADGELPQGARPGELPAGVAELPEPVKTRRRRAPS